MTSFLLNIRPGLRWLLIGSLLACVWAILWPSPSPQVVAPSSLTQLAANPTPEFRTDLISHREGARAVALATEEAPQEPWDPAAADPFVGLQAPPPKPAPPPPAQPASQPASAPAAPTLNYRYLGQMTGVAGEQILFIARAEKPFQVAAGSQLEEGFVVQSIDDSAIHLLHPGLNVKADIPIPPPR